MAYVRLRHAARAHTARECHAGNCAPSRNRALGARRPARIVLVRSSTPKVLALDDNWVETIWYGRLGRTRLTVVHHGKAVHMDEVADDPSGARAYAVATEWASTRYPGVSFHWKHDTHERWNQQSSEPGNESD